MYSNGFIPLIPRPTTVTNSSDTLINNIFTNQFSSQPGESAQDIGFTDISDNDPAFCAAKRCRIKKVKNTVVSKRSHDNKNKRKQADLCRVPRPVNKKYVQQHPRPSGLHPLIPGALIVPKDIYPCGPDGQMIMTLHI